jgi:hypothetical protein
MSEFTTAGDLLNRTGSPTNETIAPLCNLGLTVATSATTTVLSPQVRGVWNIAQQSEMLANAQDASTISRLVRLDNKALTLFSAEQKAGVLSEQETIDRRNQRTIDLCCTLVAFFPTKHPGFLPNSDRAHACTPSVREAISADGKPAAFGGPLRGGCRDPSLGYGNDGSGEDDAEVID